MKLGLMKLGLVSIVATAMAGVAVFGVGCSETKRAEDVESQESMINGVPTGDIRGVVDISNTLRTRLLDDTAASTAMFDVSRVAGDPIFRLRRQLGVFAPSGTGSEYQGGTPTPFSMTLWHQVMGRVAEGFGRSCEAGATPNTVRFLAYTGGGGFGSSGGFGSTSSGGTSGGFGSDAGAGAGTGPGPTVGVPFALYPEVATKVAATCKFEGDETARREASGVLFDAVMGRGASLAAERQAFVKEYATEGSPWQSSSPRDRVSAMFLTMLLNPHFLLAK